MAMILVALDGSDLARDAASTVVDLLGRDQTFELVTAVSPYAAPESGTLGRLDRPLLADDVIAAHRRLAQDEALAVGRALDLDGEVRIETGEPGPTICTVAREVDADLVVVGSHGRGAVGRALLGSVSRHVLEHAPCPVLVHRASHPD